MHLKVVVETMLGRPEQSLGRLSLLTANEERLFSSWNNTQLPDQPDRSVDEVFECRVKEPPAYAAPGTPTEVELAGLWSALLPVEKPGIDDDFFDLGGHSLLGMELIAKIQERFGLKLSVTEFFDQNTIRKVALTIDKISQLRMEMEGDLLEEEGGQITKI
jgi:acyl carrier protein